ncbi:MAG: hypothetical protein ACREQA_09875 [Candidatus Binatia bacterium]
MKTQQEDKLFTKEGLLIGALLFSIYLACLLQIDPEWVMWIGFMSLGTYPPPEFPPPLFADPRDAFQVASSLMLLGLLGLLLLMVIMGDVNLSWLSWLKAQWRDRWSREGREIR